MDEVAAIRGVYVEQWLHEHRDELPSEVADYIESLRSGHDSELHDLSDRFEQAERGWSVAEEAQFEAECEAERLREKLESVDQCVCERWRCRFGRMVEKVLDHRELKRGCRYWSQVRARQRTRR